jgi:hypothetical protein
MEEKPEVLNVMYSIRKEEHDYDSFIVIKIHGIFTDTEIPKYKDLRRKINAKVMIVPLNKFVEEGGIMSICKILDTNLCMDFDEVKK